MTKLSSLPANLEELRTSIPDGFTLAERIIDPIIIIDRTEGRTTAKLAGTRLVRGHRKIYVAPTAFHSWVVDDKTLRPLPRGSVELFAELLSGNDPNDLPYDVAIKALRSDNGIMAALPGEGFLQSGRTAAEHLDGQIEIAGLTANLFPYQARGVRWMHETIAHTGGLILADEMGLGKTVQIIALLLTERIPMNTPALIACPTSLIANWVREFSRFAPDITVLVHRGPHRAGIFRELQKANVVIATYDTIVNDISIFSAFEWSWVICDEAQAIKNPASIRRQAIVSIPRRHAIAMTGTPVENSLLDLWSLADFVIPNILGTRDAFEVEFPDSKESAQRLGPLTDPIILKRLVADVAGDLPERTDIDIPLELDERLADHYQKVLDETLAKYPVAGAMVATLQLQMVCAHPWLRRVDSDVDEEFATLNRDASIPLITPKMERAVDLLNEAFINGNKVIVFALFNRIGDLLYEACAHLPKAFWGAINGSTAQADRQGIIDAFSSHLGPGCLILNPKAAGAGLNITAATIVIHFTPVWNPALEAQASARAHRRGQTQPVRIYRLFYEDTVERVMIDRSLWKHELGNEIVPVSSRDALDLKRALAITPRGT